MSDTPLSSKEIVESLIQFAQHSSLCLVSQWQPTDEEDFDCPDCTCGLTLLERHGKELAARLAHLEPTWPHPYGYIRGLLEEAVERAEADLMAVGHGKDGPERTAAMKDLQNWKAKLQDAWTHGDLMVRRTSEPPGELQEACALLRRCHEAMCNFFSNVFDGGRAFSELTADIPKYLVQKALPAALASVTKPACPGVWHECHFARCQRTMRCVHGPAAETFATRCEGSDDGQHECKECDQKWSGS